MIHELSNPINNILLTAGVLQEDYENLPEEERLDMIDSLVKESERAQEIARKFSDFAGGGEIRSESVEAPNIIRGALQLARNEVKRAKVKVKGELAPDLPAIYGDQRQLELVFLNIVLNALDAMPDGGTLTMSCESNTDGNSILVEFSDTGLGIPEENIQNIFKPFFTTKPGYESDGLGLSISLEIIKRHGGDIHVKSQPGKGSVFTIQLPTTEHPSDISKDQ
jgi:signal transduction histidine kinase